MNADQPAVSPVGPLESYCPRSLAPTLVGALTMLAFFTAQTWGFKVSNLVSGRGSSDAQASSEPLAVRGSSDAQASSESVQQDGCLRLIWIMFAMCQPLVFLHVHVFLAFKARGMERRLKKVEGIRSGKRRASTKWTDSFKYWDSRSVRSLLAAKAWIKLAEAPAVERSTSLVAASSSEVQSSHPLEIFPEMMLNPSPLHESEGDQTTGVPLSALNSPVDQCFLLSDEGKQALLELGLVPSYEQLRYVKSKSGVEIAIVALQTAGYLLGILERMATHQRISPIEALATFLGILMILHSLLQWFASSGYKRTLLFHLDPRQFFHWQIRVERINERSAADRCSYEAIFPFVLLISGLTVLLLLVPAIYFAVDFLVPHHRCLLCFIPALFFSLHLILLLLLYILFFTDRHAQKNYCVGVPLSLVIMLLYVSSVVVAVIATVLEWDHKFNEPTKSWYRWIIPHIGS